jgi:hypothetical protein
MSTFTFFSSLASLKFQHSNSTIDGDKFVREVGELVLRTAEWMDQNLKDQTKSKLSTYMRRKLQPIREQVANDSFVTNDRMTLLLILKYSIIRIINYESSLPIIARF